MTTSKETQRLKALAGKMVEVKEERLPAVSLQQTAVVSHSSLDLVPNAPHGQKSDHVKVTITLPPKVYQLLMEEVTRRKVSKGKEGPSQLSAIIREAVVDYIKTDIGLRNIP